MYRAHLYVYSAPVSVRTVQLTLLQLDDTRVRPGLVPTCIAQAPVNNMCATGAFTPRSCVQVPMVATDVLQQSGQYHNVSTHQDMWSSLDISCQTVVTDV